VSIEVLAVGDELLSGATLETNSNWIARALFESGLDLGRVTIVGDDAAPLADAVAAALTRARVLIVTGGLGPTLDDRTKEIVAAHLGDPLELDAATLEDIRDRFARRGLVMSEVNTKQALLPRGGTRIPNPIGSAPGVHWQRDGREIFLLPGVPREMQAMMQATVLPRVAALYPEVPPRRAIFRTVGLPESELAQRLLPLTNANDAIGWAFYPGTDGVDVRLRSSLDAVAWDAVRDGVRSTAGAYIYSETAGETLAAVVLHALRARNWTFVTAESCTGGFVSQRVTDVPGSSTVFRGGFVTYANAAKVAWLGVSEELLAAHGAVSAAVAVAMARGARARAESDVAIAVTGIAGPDGGTPEKPVGLIYFGLATAAGCWTRRLQLGPDRDTNRRYSSQLALDMVRRHLQGLPAGEPA